MNAGVQLGFADNSIVARAHYRRSFDSHKLARADAGEACCLPMHRSRTIQIPRIRLHPREELAREENINDYQKSPTMELPGSPKYRVLGNPAGDIKSGLL